MTVVFDVRFGRFCGMMSCVVEMALSGMGVVGCRFVVTCLVMLCGVAVVARRVVMVLGCFAMMLGRFS